MEREKLASQIHEYIQTNKDLTCFSFDGDTRVKFLAQGEYNMNFLIETPLKKYVFRVNTGSQLQLDNQIQYEYDSLRFLEKSGVTPKVYFVDDSRFFFEHGVLMMEFLEGRPLQYNCDLQKAAAIFSKIHSLPIEKGSHLIVEKHLFQARIEEGERLLENVWDSGAVDLKVKSIFEKLLDWTKNNLEKEEYFIEDPWHVVNNTEVNSHNFIIGKEHSYLIDWEKPVISDPAQDLTQFMAPTTTLWKTEYLLSREDKETFFQKYIDGLTVEDRNIRDRVHLYTPYLLLRALAWCAYAFVEYQNPNKEIRNEDTLAKIKEFLQVDFMEKLLKEYIS